MTKETIIENLIQERIVVLNTNKTRLEEQITQATGKEIELPEQFEDQRRVKLAEIIKELKLLNDETSTIIIRDIDPLKL